MKEGFKDFTTQINAISMYCVWICMLSFFRLFRGTGYLIRLIIEVINDMQCFLAVIGVTLLSFTGSFYILAKGKQLDSTEDSILELSSSYLEAGAFTF